MVLQESELLSLLVITRYVKGPSVLSCRESKNGYLVTVHCFIVQATAEAICRRIGVFEPNEDTTGITRLSTAMHFDSFILCKFSCIEKNISYSLQQACLTLVVNLMS